MLAVGGRRRAGFPAEAVRADGIGGEELRVDDLHGDAELRAFVLGLVDGAHSALAEEREELVFAIEGLAEEVCCGHGRERVGASGLLRQCAMCDGDTASVNYVALAMIEISR